MAQYFTNTPVYYTVYPYNGASRAFMSAGFGGLSLCAARAIVLLDT